MLKHPNNDFIGACFDIDMVLARLQKARANHFGVDPNVKRTWDEIISAKQILELLTQAANFAEGKTP